MRGADFEAGESRASDTTSIRLTICHDIHVDTFYPSFAFYAFFCTTYVCVLLLG